MIVERIIEKRIRSKEEGGKRKDLISEASTRAVPSPQFDVILNAVKNLKNNEWY
ncbi:hypothetical protein KZP23_08540 [Echinicola marina]|uniref:hypothetical protein n=1 Tax=Echinicola marina TaxID=2859768 RepID=UPI001CF65A5B|nr:hypothetical protein [Echinicola marina]UCS95042.1 hypothetical protein KZP23_08540 [Echinicola marina]